VSRISESIKSLSFSLREKLMKVRFQEGWVAVNFHGDALSVAHVRRRPGHKPEVLMLRSEPSPSGLQPGLRGLTREFGLNQCRCNQLLNVGEYQFLQVELPSVSPEELKDAARWHVKDMVSYEVESMTMDVLEVPVLAGRTGRGHQGFVVAADDGLIAEQMAAFNSADAMLEAIDIPEMALRNVAALFEEPERGLAMLAFDEERITLIFTFHGELYAVRQIEIPRSKLEQSEGEWRRQMFDRIGLETQRSLDNFERLHSHISVSRLLLSPLPTVPGLMDYMREYISLPVAEVDLAEVLDISLVPELAQPGRQATCLKLLGAALRD
jgi:MSHA biogenesis protein MshI